MDAAVAVDGLVKRYGSTLAVDDLTLVARPGAVTAVLGPNGAGKTTTIEVCEGFRRADAGSVRVLGLPPGSADLRHRVGVMPQQPGAYPGARCAEMLRLVASYYADPLDPAGLLERLELLDAARTPFRRLSGGQKQRLSLAMAVVGRPEVVFLDEPGAGLDVRARETAWELVRELRSQGVAVVLSTHQLDEADRLADEVVIVSHGRVLAAGSVAELTRGDAEGQLRFRAPAGLDLPGLLRALPEGTGADERLPGQYLITGAVTPQLLAAVTAWTAGVGALAQDLRMEERSLQDVYLELTSAGRP